MPYAMQTSMQNTFIVEKDDYVYLHKMLISECMYVVIHNVLLDIAILL